MKFFISYLQDAHLREYEKQYVPQFSAEVDRQSASTRVRLVDRPEQADFIILWEGFEYKTPRYIDLLEADPLVRKHADRVYSINYDDHPEGFLAGAYTSLEAPFFLPEIHRIQPFFLMNNPRVYDLTREDVLRYAPSKLFSFRGAASHPIRKRLFSLYPTPTEEFHVEHVKRWYDHADDDRLAFARLALDSIFCLCPHGYAAYTPRITEVMSLARVPVIIADDWIPFSFGEETPYYIKVAEKDVDRLPQILRERAPEAESLRRNARRLWEEHCSPERRAVSIVESLAALAQRPGPKLTYDAYRDRWRSRALMKNLGWTPVQRLALRLEQHLQRRIPGARMPGVSPLMRYRNASHAS